MWVQVLRSQRSDVLIALGLLYGWAKPTRRSLTFDQYRAILGATVTLEAIRAAEEVLQRAAEVGVAEARTMLAAPVSERVVVRSTAMARNWASEYAAGAVEWVDNTSARRLSEGLALWSAGQEVERAEETIDQLYSDVRAATIGITLTSRGYNVGAMTLYRSVPEIKGLQWITWSDERTCPQCGLMDGAIGTLGGSFGGVTQPAHARCRCTVVPWYGGV